MKPPHLLTSYLITTSALTFGHVLPKSHFKHGLSARLFEPPEDPDLARGDGARPRPAVVPEGESAPEEQPIEVYHRTLQQKPTYGYNMKSGLEAGVLEQMPDTHGLSMRWSTQADGVSAGTRDLQQLNKLVGKAGDVVRFDGPKAPHQNAEDISRARQELEDVQDQWEEQFHSWVTDSPLDEIMSKVYKLSMSSTMIRNAGFSDIDHQMFRDEMDDTPFSISYFDARKPPVQDPPTLNVRGASGFSVVDGTTGGHARVIDLSPNQLQQFAHEKPPPNNNNHHQQQQQQKKRSTLTQISTDSSSPNTTLSSESAQFQAYLLAYFTAQSHISALLFPHLDTLLAGTNSSLAYNMAWSLYADLTGAPLHVVSPFSNGLNCIDWIEETWRNHTTTAKNSTNHQYHNNTTTTLPTNTTNTTSTPPPDIPMLSFLLSARALRPLYESTWRNVSAAANASGWLGDLATLSAYLIPADASVATAGFFDTVDFREADMAYFNVRNGTMGGGGGGGNGTVGS